MTRAEMIQALTSVVDSLEPVGTHMDASFISGCSEKLLSVVLEALEAEHADPALVRVSDIVKHYEATRVVCADAMHAERFPKLNKGLE